MTYPRWQWELVYSGYIREGSPWFDFENLNGFYLAQYGPLSSLLFRDQLDNQVTGQFIATGDGVTTAFQLVRTFNGFNEPIYVVDTRGAITYGPYTQPAALTPQAYDNGSPITANFSLETGILTTGTLLSPVPISAGHILTATFSFGFRVRFVDDELDFKNVFNTYWQLDSLKLIETRV